MSELVVIVIKKKFLVLIGVFAILLLLVMGYMGIYFQLIFYYYGKILGFTDERTKVEYLGKIFL